MLSLPNDLKDVAAITFGSTAFAISLITLIRSVRTERRTRHGALKQKQHDAIMLGQSVQLSMIKLKSVVLDVQDEASENGYSDIVEILDPFIERYDKALIVVQRLLDELKKELPKFGTKQWHRVSDAFDQMFVQLQGLANTELNVVQQEDDLIRHAKTNIRLKKRIASMSEAR